MSVPSEEVGFYRKLNPNKIGKPLNMDFSQNEDTLTISFVLHTGNAEAFYGDVAFKNDSLFLLLGRGTGLREMATHRYVYRVLNLEKKLPPFVIQDVGSALGRSR